MRLDLCSGIGIWDSDTIRVDIDPKVKPDIVADIRTLKFPPGTNFEHIHASIPCTYISRARRWRWGWNPLGIAETFRLAAAAFDIFASYGQSYSFEWPAGFEDFLGKKVSFTYDKSDIRNATTNFYLGRKALRRAEIPSEIRRSITEILNSQAILSAVEASDASAK